MVVSSPSVASICWDPAAVIWQHLQNLWSPQKLWALESGQACDAKGEPEILVEKTVVKCLQTQVRIQTKLMFLPDFCCAIGLQVFEGQWFHVPLL